MIPNLIPNARALLVVLPTDCYFTVAQAGKHMRWFGYTCTDEEVKVFILELVGEGIVEEAILCKRDGNRQRVFKQGVGI